MHSYRLLKPDYGQGSSGAVRQQSEMEGVRDASGCDQQVVTEACVMSA